MPESPDLVAQRLNRLESDLRHWKQFGLIAFAVIAVALALASGGLLGRAKDIAEITESRAFILRDGANNTRAELTVESDGSPALSLFDTAGRQRIRLAVDPDGRSRLTFSDEDKIRLWLAQEIDGRTRLLLNDSQGTPRLELNLDNVGSPALVMMDSGQTIRAAFGIDGETIPGVFLRGKDGQSRASLSVPAQGALLGLTDTNGKVSFQVPQSHGEDSETKSRPAPK